MQDNAQGGGDVPQQRRTRPRCRCGAGRSFLPGTGLGGARVHWNGQTYRFQATDFICSTHIEQRYGKNFVDPDLTIQDWGVTYDELEPHYDRFEYLLRHQRQGRQHQGHRSSPAAIRSKAPRSREYPTPPMKEPYSGALFRKAATDLGYHPFPAAVVEPEPALHQSRKA